MNSTQRWAVGIASTLVVALFGGLVTVATLWATQSKELGRIEANNENLSSQNTDLRQQNASLRAQVDDLATRGSSATVLHKSLEDHQSRLQQAYEQIEHLQAENSRLAFMADSKQRCAPYRDEITALQNELSGRSGIIGRYPEPYRKEEINVLLKEHHETLRACLGAKP